jgi:hypothetical protein
MRVDKRSGMWTESVDLIRGLYIWAGKLRVQAGQDGFGSDAAVCATGVELVRELCQATYPAEESQAVLSLSCAE